MICDNFDAFNTKLTILMIFDTNLLHYLQSATRPVEDLNVSDNNSINVSSYRLQNYHTMILDDIIEANIYRHFRGPRANAEIAVDLAFRIRRCSSARSAGCHQLFVPRHRRSMFGRRAFSVAGPAAWNSLPETTCEIRHVPLTVFAGT